MAKEKKYLLSRAKVMVCNSSAIFFLVLVVFTVIELRYANKSRKLSEDIAFDLVTTHELVNIIPQIGYRIREIHSDQIVGNTTQLYYHLEQLRYIRQSFSADASAFSLLSNKVQGLLKNKKQYSGTYPNNMQDVMSNDLGLGFNVLHLHLGDNIPSLEDDQKKLDSYLSNIFQYFRKESYEFIDLLIEYNSKQLIQYRISYFGFVIIKVLLYIILIFRMYKAISSLNSLKMSFEEYSKWKRGILPFILLLSLLCSNAFQFIFFKDYSTNTLSTLHLSTTLSLRAADLKYSQALLFEYIYKENSHSNLNGIKGNNYYQDAFQQTLLSVDKHEEDILQTIRGDINQLSSHFQLFKDELNRLQSLYDCQYYFQFVFELDGCDNFCPTTLLVFNKDRQKISKDDIPQDSKEIACQNSKETQFINGIAQSVRVVKNKIKIVKEEWHKMQLNEPKSSSEEVKDNDNKQKQLQFIYAQQQEFPNALIYNVSIHMDYLIKLLSRQFRNYQLQYFDNHIYWAIFSDLSIGIIFFLTWIFYFLYLIKGLSKHKSQFEQVNPTLQ